MINNLNKEKKDNINSNHLEIFLIYKVISKKRTVENPKNALFLTDTQRMVFMQVHQVVPGKSGGVHMRGFFCRYPHSIVLRVSGKNLNAASTSPHGLFRSVPEMIYEYAGMASLYEGAC